MVERGNSATPQAVQAQLFYGKFDRFGRPQPPYPPGQALAALPWYMAARVLAAHLPGVPAPAKNLFSDFVTVLSNASFSAAGAALALLLFLRLGIDRQTALRAALLLALATPVFSYSGWFYSEPLAALLLIAAAVILLAPSAPAASEEISLRRALLAGLALGAAVWVRPAHLIAAPVFALAVLFRTPGKKDFRSAAILGVIVGLAAGMYLLRNMYLFANPLDFGYPAAAEHGKRLNSFETPLAVGLFGFLFSPGKSVFVFAPPSVLAFAGLPRIWRRNRGLALLVAFTPLAYLLFYARYTQWEGGYCYGPRYLLPAIAVACLGLGPALRWSPRSWRRAALLLFMLGFCVQAIGLSTSFLEDQASGGYYDQNFNYRMDHNPVRNQASLLWHYLTSPQPAPLGRGFDRWFVLLDKAHVSRLLLFILGTLFAAGLVFSGMLLRRAVSDATYSNTPQGARARAQISTRV